MGFYFNPGSESFKNDTSGLIYVDKTGLIRELNKLLKTPDKCVALSHARRFGKSQAAGMIDAYYSCGNDSRDLFSRFEISKDPEFEKHLNKYNVIHLDISSVEDFNREDLVEKCISLITYDMKREYPEIDYTRGINVIINQIYEFTGRPFVIIIDEWDCVVRNQQDRQDLVHKYLQFLHSLFKSEESKSFLALAYITGILPVKKIRNESALNNFREYTMINSWNLTKYFGFTEEEIKELCITHNMDFESVKRWYDGYTINGLHIYNPNSVCQAMSFQALESFWKNTSSFETINDFIALNFDGLKDDVLEMLSGGRVEVDTNGFQNDLSVINTKDDALTALIHLGYLGYDNEEKEAFIPNYEVSLAYQAALKISDWKDIAASISKCDSLLKATIKKDADKVAQILELSHETYTSILKYNDENSLACAITMAYFTAPAYYTIIRELPSGKGFADFAFIPRKEAKGRPALIIELKWDNTAETAIKQIKEKRYTGALSGYKDEILLVGISYAKEDEKKMHTCVIESL